MHKNKLVLMVLLVAVLGAGAHFYLRSLNHSSPLVPEKYSESDGTKTPVSDKAALPEAADQKSDIKNEKSTESPKPPITTKDRQSAGDINTDLTDLDSLFEETYDDSSLDAEFDQTGANSLTESYDI